MVKKSEVMSDQSLDMRHTAKRVKDRMWWKNKKVLIGIIALILVIILVIVLVVVSKSG